MLLSKSCVYAIRAAILVSSKESQGERHFIPVQELARELELSFHFLTKIFQILSGANIMASSKGPRGGVGLAKPADSIYLIDIVRAIDGMKAFDGCVLGLPECSSLNPCPLHEQWAVRRRQLQHMFEVNSLATITRKSRNEKNKYDARRKKS